MGLNSGASEPSLCHRQRFRPLPRRPSDYRDFAAYLRDADRSTFRIAGEFLLVGGDGWADFEQRLAEFDEDQAIDYASQFIATSDTEIFSTSFSRSARPYRHD